MSSPDQHDVEKRLKDILQIRWLRLFPRAIPTHVTKQLKNLCTLAHSYAQLDSMEKWSCVDRSGKAIPWYTYPTIEYLKNLDFSEKRVFEYGSGNSSLWWASRCRHLISIESDREWFEKIKNNSIDMPNFDYRLIAEKDAYIQQDDILGSNVVIIDGLHRSACADFFMSQIASGKLHPDLLIFDNSDWYPSTMKRLNAFLGDWVQIDFSGFGPINDYTWTTSIFANVRPDKKVAYASPLSSVAGLAHIADDDR
jgi:hypothetical protein